MGDEMASLKTSKGASSSTKGWNGLTRISRASVTATGKRLSLSSAVAGRDSELKLAFLRVCDGNNTWANHFRFVAS